MRFLSSSGTAIADRPDTRSREREVQQTPDYALTQSYPHRLFLHRSRSRARRRAVRCGWPTHVGGAVITAQFVLAIAFLPVVTSPVDTIALRLIGFGQLLFGVGIGLGSPHELAYRQTVKPDRLQGRMNATIRSINWGTIAIAPPLGARSHRKPPGERRPNAALSDQLKTNRSPISVHAVMTAPLLDSTLWLFFAQRTT
jgi:hypothetical protein